MEPMRIQARRGSAVERRYYTKSALPGQQWPLPKAIAPGVSPKPLEDLIFHGGKIVPQMQLQNIYLGAPRDWEEREIEAIERSLTAAMQDKRLNQMMAQYFYGAALLCDARERLLLNEPKPKALREPEARAALIDLYDTGRLTQSDLDKTIFNLLLPSGSVLMLDDASSLDGLGGYHGSVHIQREGRRITLYYSASVYSQTTAQGENGVDAFGVPWKNIVATLYHMLNEFRTNADISDAIEYKDNDFLGWMSRTGRECGDAPIVSAPSLSRVFREVSFAGSAKKLPIQLMYSNFAHGPEEPPLRSSSQVKRHGV